VNAFFGEWHVAQAKPRGVERPVSKNRALPTEAFVGGSGGADAVPPLPPQLMSPAAIPEMPVPNARTLPIRLPEIMRWSVLADVRRKVSRNTERSLMLKT
jgi:hypothetical protein